MPYKSEKIIISNTKHDKRCKLTQLDREKIVELIGLLSCNECARQFGVSKRTIQFIWYPERLERNKLKREERGGWKQYYDTNKNNEYHTTHRHYKQDLYLKGQIGKEKKK